MNNLKSILIFEGGNSGKLKNTFFYGVRPKVKTAHDIYYEIRKCGNCWLICRENSQYHMQSFNGAKTFKEAEAILLNYIGTDAINRTIEYKEKIKQIRGIK